VFRVVRNDRAHEEELAQAANFFVACAAFDEAVRQWPKDTLLLKQGIRLIKKHN
jgi:hypothetical protein